MRARSKRTGRFLKGGRRSPAKRRRRRNPHTSTGAKKTNTAPNRPRRRRRTARRPARRGARFFGVSIPPVRTLVAGVAGMAAVRTLPGIIAMRLPAVPTVGAPGIAVRAAIALFGGRLVAATAGVQAGKDFTLGGMLSVADELARTYVLPNIGLGAYLPTHDADPFAAYLPGGEAAKYEIAPGRSVAPTRLDAGQRFG